MRRKLLWRISLFLIAVLAYLSGRVLLVQGAELQSWFIWLFLIGSIGLLSGYGLIQWLKGRKPRGAGMIHYSQVKSNSSKTPLASKDEEAATRPNRIFFGGTENYTPEAATSHFFLVGGTGSGKTLNFQMMMDSVLPSIWNSQNEGHENDHRAVIFDVKQDMISTLLALNTPPSRLRIFNPFDSRCYAWDVARDIDAPDTTLQLGTILINKDQRETNPYFSDAARDLVCGVMDVFNEKGQAKEGGAQWQLADVILTMRTPDRVQHVLSQSPRGRDLIALHLRGEVTSLNILSMARTKLAPFEVVAAMWKRAAEQGRCISLKEFLGSPLVMVLGNNQAALAPIQAINRVIFQRLTELMLDQSESSSRRTWFFLDEARKIGRLPGLEDLMTNGRSKGACVVLGFQDIAGMREVYGAHVAEEILGMCGSFGVLKVSGATTPQWASLIMGEREEPIATRGFSLTDTGRITENEGENWGIRPLLLPSQFRSLPRPEKGKPLYGYFRSAFIENPEHRDMVYKAEVLPTEISRRLRTTTAEQRALNFVPWPNKDAKLLHDWNAGDYDRLNLPPELDALLSQSPEVSAVQSTFRDPYAAEIRKSNTHC